MERQQTGHRSKEGKKKNEVLAHRYHIVPDDLYHNLPQSIHVMYCGNLTNVLISFKLTGMFIFLSLNFRE
jgi:hypothetical protein